MEILDTYYNKVITQLIDTYSEVLESAEEGHCMKLTGIPNQYLQQLKSSLESKFKNIDYFIVDDSNEKKEGYITATKLIELRNSNPNPLLAIIPTNSRTAAEDSYGNATFQNLGLTQINKSLVINLFKELPPVISGEVEKLFDFLKINIHLGEQHVINFLIALGEIESVNEIGKHLNHLLLLPDDILHTDLSQFRARLNYNQICVDTLSDFSKPIYDRVRDLPLEQGTLQREIVQFFKNHPDVNNKDSIINAITKNYPQLNFSKWKIPEIDSTKIKVYIENIKDGSNKRIENKSGDSILSVPNNGSAKIKVKFYTNPAPNQIEELHSFRILLMMAEEKAEHSELIRFKNTASRLISRTKTASIYANSVDDGNYYIKVEALDEDGNVLNKEDEFRDTLKQEEWENLSPEEKEIQKEYFNLKLTSDSDNFTIFVDEVEDVVETRKAKLHNVAEAFYWYRIDELKNGKDSSSPEFIEEETVWQEKKLLSTFVIKYSNRHHFQIILSKKLKALEQQFLNKPKVIGYVKAELSSNSNEAGIQKVKLHESLLSRFVTEDFLSKREMLFDVILNDIKEGEGIFESFELFKHQELVFDYLNSFYKLTKKIREPLKEISDETTEEAENLAELSSALLSLDICYVKTQLPNETPIEVALISPLHPLRLYWFIIQFNTFLEWEQKTKNFANHIQEWKEGLDEFFLASWAPSLQPLTLIDPVQGHHYLYNGDLSFGWGLYTRVLNNSKDISLNSRQILNYLRNLLNVDKSQFSDVDFSKKIIVKSILNYVKQHPYVGKLVVNIINGGEAYPFAEALVELEKDDKVDIQYELRLIESKDKLVQYGKGIKELLNPNYNQSEEAESFSQASKNSLFPKLRYSINSLDDYLKKSSEYISHVTFLIHPFPLLVTLEKPNKSGKSSYVGGLIMEQESVISEKGGEYTWSHFYSSSYNKVSNTINENAQDTFHLLQRVAAFALAKKDTDSLPATKLILSKSDSVLLSKLHRSSDWVITIDRHIGPEIYDLPSDKEDKPFLLDYLPGSEIGGISSFLTTHPTSEITGMIGPHFSDMGLDIEDEDGKKKIISLLEDIRAVSSSLLLQLNLTENQAFEVIGIALSKRVLSKKGILKNNLIIPIDLHKDLFITKKDDETRSRADLLLALIDPEKREIQFTILEVKCRSSVTRQGKEDLISKMKEQIDNTEYFIRKHFDPELAISYDRLDRSLKNYQLRSILNFYLERSKRFELITDLYYDTYKNFINNLDDGFTLKFKKLGFIFNYAAPIKHEKNIMDNDYTFFTFGKKLLPEILDDKSDLDTRRLDRENKVDDVQEYFKGVSDLTPFLKELRDEIIAKPKDSVKEKPEPIVTVNTEDKKTTEEDSSSNVIKETSPIKEDEREKEKPSQKPKVTIEKEDSKPIVSISAKASSENQTPPDYSILIGSSKPSPQYGILGATMQNRKIGIDLNETSTVSLFGVQGGGKSYSIGSVMEMVLKPIHNVNLMHAPMAGVIFHYSESMDYEPEFTSMKYPNDKEGELKLLKDIYGAEPNNIEDVLILAPSDKVDERRVQFPSLTVQPIAFNSNELDVKAWMFLLGALNNDSTYIRQLKSIMRQHRNNIKVEALRESIEESTLLTNSQKALALQRLQFAAEYIDDNYFVSTKLKPGRLIIVDLRDEFIDKDEALGLFVIMLNVFSSITQYDGKRFNKFIVFDEAHKYMDNKSLAGKIVEAIREMRHKGVSIMIASQDPPSLPNEIIELSSAVIIHKFNSPTWLKHIQKSITNLNSLRPADMASLSTGEAFLWSSKATEKGVTQKPLKIRIRPRVTKHGGGTIKATDH